MLANFAVSVATGATWHHELYLDGGGHWRKRIRVQIENRETAALVGRPVNVAIGERSGEANLAGQSVEGLRVCDSEGTEMKLAVYGPQGELVTDGLIADGSVLLIPVECPVGGTSDYFVYFDNPLARRVPDSLATRPGLFNGDVELGEGDTPEGWSHDATDEQHRVLWSSEKPQSGKRCLKTVVSDGAKATWIATRQHGIPVVAGARYRMRAWVKADHVQGYAGWYLHVGNQAEPMMMAPTLRAGDGTFDWKEVSLDFTAPAEADRVSLGTVLRGTGTAWFDNLRFECLSPNRIRVTTHPPETTAYREVGADTAWQPYSHVDDLDWEYRAAVHAFNPHEEDREETLVAVNISRLETRVRGQLQKQSLRVMLGDTVVPHAFLGRQLLLRATLPGNARTTFYIYYTSDPRLPAVTSRVDDLLSQSGVNLVKNAGFETGDTLPDGWTTTETVAGSSVAFGLDDPQQNTLGRRCARMDVPRGEAATWRGWHQTVAVEPGRSYLLAAWLKCRDIQRGEARVHAHRHTASGQLSKHQPFLSIGPSITGTTDWTLLTGTVTMPEDTVSLRLHLTMDETGTLWHDGIFMNEVVPARIVHSEGRPGRRSTQLGMWQVPAVVKVFPDDPTPTELPPWQIAAARNEAEPLQLAIRSQLGVSDARVMVASPVGPGGFRLDEWKVNVVGYVPIDAPTNYYRSESPPWHRKKPRGGARSDGWPGMWPDPLLPTDTLDVPANTTQAVWITVSIPEDAPHGDYTGRVRLVAEGKELLDQAFQVHVWDFTLPKTSHVAAIYDVRLGHGASRWGKPLEDIYPDIIRFMAERRLCPDTVRPAPAFERSGDGITADFTAFDRAAKIYFEEFGFPYAYTPWSLYVFGWGHPPKPLFGEQPYVGNPPDESVDRRQLRPEYKRAYQQMLRLYWNHVKEKGWADRIVLYVSDEPFDRHEHIQEQMKAICEMIHEVDPDIPIYSSTWKHVPEWDGFLNVWGIGHDGRVPIEKMAELREAGDRLWFTTDGQMCTDTPYCAVERLLPHYCFKYGVEAYEFWGLSWLTHDPYKFGWHTYIHQTSEPGNSYWVRYPNGDGFLLYPPVASKPGQLVSSIRLEQAREGVEDYEYLYLLRSKLTPALAAGRPATLAQDALQAAAGLVAIPNAGGCKSSDILPHPMRLYEIRREVATAIEQITHAD
jgi:hypothetical protein